MLEVAVGICLAVLILVYYGQVRVLAAAVLGALLVPIAAGFTYLLNAAPLEIAIGIVTAAIVIGSVSREAGRDREEGR